MIHCPLFPRCSHLESSFSSCDQITAVFFAREQINTHRLCHSQSNHRTREPGDAQPLSRLEHSKRYACLELTTVHHRAQTRVNRNTARRKPGATVTSTAHKTTPFSADAQWGWLDAGWRNFRTRTSSLLTLDEKKRGLDLTLKHAT